MKLKTRAFAALAVTLSLGSTAFGADYCLAIRGNGELEPAHWGGAARIIEALGLPKAQAGGSSATITMMLIDAIASNRLIIQARGDQKKADAALLLKSLEGFLLQLTDTDQWRDFLKLYREIGQLKKAGWSTDLKQLLDNAATMKPDQARAFLQANAELIERNYATGVRLGFISQTSYAPLFQALNRLRQGGMGDADLASDLRVARFYAHELYTAISVFGNFDAQTDTNLFFRPGLVDFDKLADQFGRIAEFYSMASASPAEQEVWSKFLGDCADASKGTTWDKLVASRPQCSQELAQLMRMHFQGAPRSFASKPLGSMIPSFPSTAVLIGKAHADAEKAQAEYRTALDPNFGNSFKIQDSDEVRFGYWGRPNMLATAAQHLDSSDEKSRRFLNLGDGTWKQVLGLSPAEPGLSPFKSFVSHGTPMTSAGGWADLHPVLILKAAGCENVVYLTRRGGESLFGQGVAKRLLGYSRSWSLLNSSSDEAKLANAKINNNGDPNDMTSLWSRLYNLANRNSSFKRALINADAVLCTDWDSHEITEGVRPMIEDAYFSPYYVPMVSGLRSDELSPQLNPEQMSSEGYPAFAGCF